MAEPEQDLAASYFLRAPTDVILEIVRRLPAVSVIRLRAVCKAWRDVTSAEDFVKDLHELKPSQPLLCFVLEAWPHRYADLKDYCVEAVTLRSGELGMSPIFRFTNNTYCYHDQYVDSYEVAPIEDDDDDIIDYGNDMAVPVENFQPLLMVHASLDGLLLASFTNNWYVCNPATRQWAALPELNIRDVLGLYRHDPSGEYRVLYHTGQNNAATPTCYYVLTVGSQVARSIGCPISPAAVKDFGLADGLDHSSRTPPIQLHGKLHWPPQERQRMNLLVFDTEAEVFSWMVSSPGTLRKRSETVGQCRMTLLQMNDKLGMSVCRAHGEELELLCLEDYQNVIWVMLHLIKLPVLPMPSLHHYYWFPSVVSPEGDVMIAHQDGFIHCNRHGEELHSLWSPEKIRISSIRHHLKESLLPHQMFLQPKGDAVPPPFFRGL